MNQLRIQLSIDQSSHPRLDPGYVKIDPLIELDLIEINYSLQILKRAQDDKKDLY